MCVVPEKSKRSTDERAAKNRQFANARNVLNLEIRGPAVVAAYIGQYRERSSRNDRAANRQAVQSIRQIYGVGGTHDDDGRRYEKRQKRQRPEVTGKVRFIQQDRKSTRLNSSHS